jgi:hypothetical protein
MLCCFSTSRRGFNLVLQLNFSSRHDEPYRKLVDPDDYRPFELGGHPVAKGALHTLAWSRLDIDLNTGEALIEEIQTDWIREALWERRYAARERGPNYYWGSKLQNYWVIRYVDSILRQQSRWPRQLRCLKVLEDACSVLSGACDRNYSATDIGHPRPISGGRINPLCGVISCFDVNKLSLRAFMKYLQRLWRAELLGLVALAIVSFPVAIVITLFFDLGANTPTGLPLLFFVFRSTFHVGLTTVITYGAPLFAAYLSYPAFRLIYLFGLAALPGLVVLLLGSGLGFYALPFGLGVALTMYGLARLWPGILEEKPPGRDC